MTESAAGWLPGDPAGLFGEGATAEETYDLLTVDVPAERWISALETARDRLGCTFFDWLSAVDEPGTGFRICAHVAALAPVRRLLVRTTVPHDAPTLPTAVGVYAGAAWHERETHEMFGVAFEGHPHLAPLLLPDSFEGHPLRKDFVLAARVAKAWPGAKEPGESADGGPKRRQMLPPGVPDPNEWGPLKGQLPPAPARPARAPRAAGDRPVRRARSVSEGSASQAGEATAPPARRARSAAEGSASQAAEGAAPVRRTRSAADGSASQAAEGATPPARRMRSASEGSASQAAEGTTPPARRTRSAAEGSASQAGEAAPRRTRPAAAGSSDAPWHHARPAFDEAPAEPQASPRRDGDQSERRSPAVPDSPSGEPETPGAQEVSPRRDGDQPERRGPAVPDSAAGEPETPGAQEASPRRDGDQPERRSPAVPDSASGEPETPAPGGAGPAGDGGSRNDDTSNPAGGDPA